MIRDAVLADSSALIALGDASGIFRPGEAEALLGELLERFHAGQLGEDHRVVVYVDTPDDLPVGWVYFAPTPSSEDVWDLWWIGVDPSQQARGIGTQLLRMVETEVGRAGGRILIIETSSQDSLASTRRFYAQRGYAECGVIPDFYADGDGKVIFSRRLEVTI